MPPKVLLRGLLLLVPVIAALPCAAGENHELPQVKNLILLIGDGMGRAMVRLCPGN